MIDVQKAFFGGYDVQQFAKWQLRYGDAGLSSNIIIPKLEPRGLSTDRKLAIFPRVILAHPADAESFARRHVRKEGNFTSVIYDSLIATVDNEHWLKQRHSLVEVFM